ncbi:MAG: glycosyltransferase family 39 protein [Phycisphaeraceae bacterium]|nr:glycosyltransferase family 39 protein [Phycisphaeraceae bacterium]
MRWANRRNTLLLILAVTVLRLVYQIALSPVELVKDEAHYWEWSRRPELSYYSKGPGVAWLIAGSTKVFGDHEWSVRLPAVLAAMVAAWALASLARQVSAGDERVGFFAAAAFLLIPAYQVIAMLMTIDGPYVACWILAVWAFWHVMRQWERDRGGAWPLAGVAMALGVGFLLKYTVVLLVPGLALAVILTRNGHPLSKLRRLRRSLSLLGAGLLFLLTISPVLIWNHQHGWPTVSHLLGRLHLAGGDEPVGASWSPLSLLDFLGSQLGMIGPAALLLMLLAARWAWRRRSRDPKLARGQILMLAASLPILLFYLVIAVFRKTQANWALAGYATLLIPVAQLAVRALPCYALRVRRWLARPEPRPRLGWMRSKPETIFQIGWHIFVGWGLVAAVAVLAVPILAGVPGLDRIIPAHRFVGQREQARAVQEFIDQHTPSADRKPLIISDHYGDASLLAFYLPGHPRVYCAGHHLGKRASAYDYFPDANLASPDLRGRDAILVESYPDSWRAGLKFDRVIVLDKTRQIYMGFNYQGLADTKDATP